MTSIRDIVEPYLRDVKSSGNENIMAICPFHRKPDGSEERDGSFAMNVYSGLWICHSCKAVGNLYLFLRTVGVPHDRITLSYQQAIDEAERYAPRPPDPLNPVDPTTEPLDEGLLGLFNYYPTLMAEEGFPPELCRRFGVGYDERHQRITFPLRDLTGQLVGISGRTVTNQKPRYKVYDQEYRDFGLPARTTQKRALLWNAHNLTRALAAQAQQPKTVVIVEGFKGALRVAQAGIDAVTALLGSSMSREQQWFLEKLDARFCLMPDNDDAGIAGFLKTVDHLLGHVANICVVEYDAPQPSDLSVEEVVEAVAQAKPFALWFAKQSSLNYT